MDFGEVGHSHNGQDTTHHKLNTHVGKLQGMTLGEEQFNYGTVWSSGKEPAAVIQPFAYDWTHRYDIDAYRRIAGYFRGKVEKETQTLSGHAKRKTVTWSSCGRSAFKIRCGWELTASPQLISTTIPGHRDSLFLVFHQWWTCDWPEPRTVPWTTHTLQRLHLRNRRTSHDIVIL